MKQKTPLKRKTPLRAKTGFKRKSNVIGATWGKKRSTELVGAHRRKSVSSLKRLKEQLWELCKQITRKRYANKDGTWNCYTSGVLITEPKGAHTGHYIPSSVCSTELRYDLRNLRIQSYMENIHHSGNTLQFRENLIRDHGEAYVHELWERNKATKGLSYRADWYEEKIREYSHILNSMLE